MDWLKIKEFFRGTDCWNCRWKNNCLSYQATKNDKLTVSVCTYKDYKCNPFQAIDVNTVLKQIARMKKKASVELNEQILAGYVTALEEVEIVINDLIQLSDSEA